MNKFKQQFSELRDSMPKYVRWLLLAAAFIVVLILLTMLMTGRRNKAADVSGADSEPVELNISTNEIDWTDTPVGDKKTENIEIRASAPANVYVRTTQEIPGLSLRTTCNSGEVNTTIPCRITLKYEPTSAMQATAVPIVVDYRGASEPEELNITDRILVSLGAVAPVIEAKPQPVVQPAPEPIQMPADTPAEIPDDVYEPEFAPAQPAAQPAPVKQEIVREIESIAPSDPFASYRDFEVPDTTPVRDTVQKVAEKCSDFAFPGYDGTGAQIGWIRPEQGGYYFHPFSDKDCNKPTGIYNPDNGIITDINDNGKKIGTDAEHIGYTMIAVNTVMPQLTDAPRSRGATASIDAGVVEPSTGFTQLNLRPAPPEEVVYSTSDPKVVMSTQPYDRSFILRQYKPIPATIVSDVRADAVLLNKDQLLPVRATVDRNVYSDNGRTIIIPTGTLLLGYVSGSVPGPYKAIGRMEIKWYQFVLPNGVEFNFGEGQDPVSGDSQGRIGVPGRGTTDYLEQFVMPMLTAIVPAAVNMIAPVADKFVNQIDLDNNTVVQSGTVRSSELAKNEIITAWNQVAQKLMVDMMDNTVPPFTIPAGTRITVYSPQDLAVVCLDSSKKCSMEKVQQKSLTGTPLRRDVKSVVEMAADDSWIGQVRGFNWSQYCENGTVRKGMEDQIYKAGLDYRNVLFYCQSNQYQAINNARQDAMYKAQQAAFQNNYGTAQNTGTGIWGNSNSGTSLTGIVGDSNYNENVLGLVQDENGYLTLPQEQAPAAATADVITCLDGSMPDQFGCCTGEEYTFIEEYSDNFCCPVNDPGGDCFPPIM